MNRDPISKTEDRIVLNNLGAVWGDFLFYASVGAAPGIVLAIFAVLIFRDPPNRAIYGWSILGCVVVWLPILYLAIRDAGRVICKLEIDDGRIVFHFPFIRKDRPWSDVEELRFQQHTSNPQFSPLALSVSMPVATFRMSSGESYSLLVSRRTAEQLWHLRAQQSPSELVTGLATNTPCPFDSGERPIPIPSTTTSLDCVEDNSLSIENYRVVRSDLIVYLALNLGLSTVLAGLLYVKLFVPPDQGKQHDFLAMLVPIAICWALLIVVSYRTIRAMVCKLTFDPEGATVHYLWRHTKYLWDDVQEMKVKLLQESFEGHIATYPVLHLKLSNNEEVALRTNEPLIRQLEIWQRRQGPQPDDQIKVYIDSLRALPMPALLAAFSVHFGDAPKFSADREELIDAILQKIAIDRQHIS